MHPEVKAAIITAAASLISAILATLIARYSGIRKGRSEGKEEGRIQAIQLFEQRMDAAPVQYVSSLDKLIKSASKAPISDIRMMARSIVSARDSLRGSLEIIAKSLNSEIDRLSKELSTKNISDEELMQTVKTLLNVWPSKKQQIQVEVKKALVEMGLVEFVNQGPIYRDRNGNPTPWFKGPGQRRDDPH